MASCYSPWWKRNIAYKIPGLYKKCPQGNYHLRWDRLCFCGMNEHCGNWHGGIGNPLLSQSRKRLRLRKKKQTD
jgi:hypothetical protein